MGQSVRPATSSVSPSQSAQSNIPFPGAQPTYPHHAPSIDPSPPIAPPPFQSQSYSLSQHPYDLDDEEKTRAFTVEEMQSSFTPTDDLDQTKALSLHSQLLSQTLRSPEVEELTRALQFAPVVEELTRALPLPSAQEEVMPTHDHASPAPYPSTLPPHPSNYPSQGQVAQPSHLYPSPHPKETPESTDRTTLPHIPSLPASSPSEAPVLAQSISYPSPQPRQSEESSAEVIDPINDLPDLTMAHLNSSSLQEMLAESRFQANEDQQKHEAEQRASASLLRMNRARVIISGGVILGLFLIGSILLLTLLSGSNRLIDVLDSHDVILPHASDQAGLVYSSWLLPSQEDTSITQPINDHAWVISTTDQLGVGRLGSPTHFVEKSTTLFRPNPHPFGSIGGHLSGLTDLIFPLFDAASPQAVVYAIHHQRNAGHLSDLMITVAVESKRRSRTAPRGYLLSCDGLKSSDHCPENHLKLTPIIIDNLPNINQMLVVNWKRDSLVISTYFNDMESQSTLSLERFREDTQPFANMLKQVINEMGGPQRIHLVAQRDTPLSELMAVIQITSPYPISLSPIGVTP